MEKDASDKLTVKEKYTREDISNSITTHQNLCRMVAEELDIPGKVAKLIIETYWETILSELKNSHRVTVTNILTLSPKYLHPYRKTKVSGEVVTVPGRVSIFLTFQTRMVEAKRIITEKFLNKKI